MSNACKDLIQPQCYYEVQRLLEREKEAAGQRKSSDTSTNSTIGSTHFGKGKVLAGFQQQNTVLQD